MSEKSRRTAIRSALVRAGHLVVAYPAGPFGGRGTSDLLVCLAPSGRFCAIEIKDEGGKPTPAQSLFLESVVAHGGSAFIAHSVTEALEGVARALAEVPERRFFT
jgi:VRR-NUC domain-containing protein